MNLVAPAADDDPVLAALVEIVELIRCSLPTRAEIVKEIGDGVQANWPSRDAIADVIADAVFRSMPSVDAVTAAIERGVRSAMSERQPSEPREGGTIAG